MSEKYFQNALKNLTQAVASGDAIEHLADQGYTPQEIKKMLDYPTPYGQVQESFWNYLLKKRIVIEDLSELGKRRERVSFVTDYDSYGRRSLRRVVEYEEGDAAVSDFDIFSHLTYSQAVYGEFSSFIKDYCTSETYVSCDFAMNKEKLLESLTEKHRLYMEGVPWKRKTVWHQLNQRMMEILPVLYELSDYHGILILPEKKEQIRF